MKLLALPLCLALTGLFAGAAAYEIHINAGGPQVVVGTDVYLADGQYTVARGYGWETGADYDTWHAIGGCPDDAIYLDAHHNCGVYHLDVPNGQYVLTLHLVDFLSHGIGQYKMGWKVNGTTVADYLDLYALAGRDYAVDYRCAVTVTNGHVLIDDIPRPRTQLAAVSLLSHTSDAVAPSLPELTEILPGFDEVILNWEAGDEVDLAGYRVNRQALPSGPVVQVQAAANLISRYVDKDVVPGTTYRYWVSAVDVYGNASGFAGPWDATPLALTDSPLPLCQIEIDPDSLALLNVDPEQEIYYSCTVTLGDSTYPAGVRYRGNVVRKLGKKSYKIHFDDGHYFEGRTKLNLNGEMCDPCLMRESLSMGLFADAGVPAPRTWWRALALNGEYMGAYCDIEQPDKRFLSAHGLDDDANIYKCEDRLVVLPDSASYVLAYDKETNESGSYDDLIWFIETLNQTPDEAFYETFIDFFDFDEFLDYYATLMLINDGDAIFKNYLLYHDLDDDIWKVIPWDMDLSWGIRWLFDPNVYTNSSLLQGVSSEGNMLYHRVFASPLFVNMFASRLYEHLSETWQAATLDARVAETHALTEPNGKVDIRKWFWEDNERLRQADVEGRGFANGRRDFILASLATLTTTQTLYINEFMASNSGTIADNYGEYDDWIELYNPGPGSVDLSQYYLTDNLSDPIQWPLPAVILPAGGFELIWADDDAWQGTLHANFKLSADGELIALHKREGSGGGPDDIDPVDLVYFGPQAQDVSRERLADGDYRWQFETDPSPKATNRDDQGIADGVPDLRLSLEAWPNPFRDRVTLRLPQAASAGVLEIIDPNGRLVRRLAPDTNGAGVQWLWDRKLTSGGTAPAGMYWARWRAAEGEASARVAPVRILLIR